MAKKDGKYIEFNEHEVVAKVIEQRYEGFNEAVKEVDFEEAKEKRMSPEQIELEKKANLQNTNRQKNKFIGEIKSGLGEKIKANPKSVKVIKKSFIDKIKDFFKRF